MKILVKKRIAYYNTGKSSFVKKDLAILKSKFNIVDFSFKANQLTLAFQLIKQFFHAIYYLPKSDAVIVQFAGYHSLVPFIIATALKKKKVIIAGGTDCVSFPSIQYGTFYKKYLRWFAKKSFEQANLILPVDETLIDYKYTYTKDDFERQGYRNYVKKIKAKEVVIYNGYDSEIWKPKKVNRIKKTFITVGANLNSRFGKKLKGIDLILELAARFPDCQFIIIGGKGLNIDLLPVNVELINYIPNSELPNVFSRYQYYLQLSISEGFPNALTEAILCGCIPIVSNVGAMPFIVNNDDFVLFKKDIDNLCDLISKVLKMEEFPNFRERIISEFPLSRRRNELLSEINELIN
jgi:glycosyltransferase involved in cell wall biosynthesis